MEIRRRSGKGIQGWSVRQKKGPREEARAREERSWREILEASQGRIIRAGLLALALGCGLHFLLGETGWLRLQALRAEEARLLQANATLAKDHAQVAYELTEDPGLSMERLLREQYRKSLKNEVVLQAVAAPADSGFGSRGGALPAIPDRHERRP